VEARLPTYTRIADARDWWAKRRVAYNLQAVGYVFAMALANALYGLGALSEKLVRPRNPQAWRCTMFALGLGFSVALPFVVPLIAFFTWVRPR
jgi:hypothetical protein